MERTDSKIDTPLAHGDSRPVRFEIVCPNGNVTGNFATAKEAAFWAAGMWPDLEQDEDRTGKGWDIQVVS